MIPGFVCSLFVFVILPIYFVFISCTTEESELLKVYRNHRIVTILCYLHVYIKCYINVALTTTQVSYLNRQKQDYQGKTLSIDVVIMLQTSKTSRTIFLEFPILFSSYRTSTLLIPIFVSYFYSLAYVCLVPHLLNLFQFCFKH